MAHKDIIESVWGEFDNLMGLHLDRLEEIEFNDDHYYFNHYDSKFGWGEQEEGEERYQSNAYTNVVDLSRAILNASRLGIQVKGERASRRTQKGSSEVEQFLGGAIYANALRFQKHPVKMATFDVLQRGWGVLGCFWDASLEGEEETEEGPRTPDEFDDFPGIIKWIDPKHFFWQEGGHRPYRIQMYTWMRRADEVKDEWGRTTLYERQGEEDYLKTGTDDTVDRYFDVWYFKNGVVTHTVVWGGTVIKSPTPMKNYKDLPYTVLSCMDTTHTNYAHKSHSMTYAMRHAVTQYERLSNYLMQNIEKHGDPVLLAMEGIEVDKRSGAITAIPEHYGNVHNAAGYLELPMSPVDLMRALQLFDREKQEASFSAFSYAQVNPESGVAGQLMTGNDRVRLNTPRDNLALGLTVALQKLLDTCSNYAGSRRMYVFEQGKGEVKVSGKDLKGWRVDLKLDVELPNDFIRDVNIAATIKNAGLPYPERYIMENLLRLPQPEEARKQIIREMVDQMPEVRMAALEIALEEVTPELREKIEQARLKAQKPELAAGIRPPGAMPPGNMPAQPVQMAGAPAGLRPQDSPESNMPLPEGVLP